MAHSMVNEPTPVDPRIERLICRLLDGEITPAERAELDAALAQDALARRLLDEYRRNDLLAVEALRADAARRTGSRRRRAVHGWRRAAIGAVLAAAAVIVLSLLPDVLLHGPGRSPSITPTLSTSPARPGVPTLPGLPLAQAPANGAYSAMAPRPNGGAFSAATSDPRLSNPRTLGGDRLPQFVDYRDANYVPVRRLRDVRSDWIGIPNPNKDVILIIGRDAQTTRLVPVSGDI